MLFSTYGPVLDIVTTRKGTKGQTMRGQAHIVFRDVQTATQAMRSLQGFDFLGKELVSFGHLLIHVVLILSENRIWQRTVSDHS